MLAKVSASKQLAPCIGIHFIVNEPQRYCIKALNLK